MEMRTEEKLIWRTYYIAVNILFSLLTDICNNIIIVNFLSVSSVYSVYDVLDDLKCMMYKILL